MPIYADNLSTGGSGGGDVGSQQLELFGPNYNNSGAMIANDGNGTLTAIVSSYPYAVPMWDNGDTSFSTVPVICLQFRAEFTTDGDLDSLVDLPAGWTYTKDGNVATVTHTVSRAPRLVNYFGYNENTDSLKMRFPTAGYDISIPINNTTTQFKLHLISAVAGADANTYALVNVYF